MACGENTPMPHQIICTSCEYYLPKTNFHLEKENTFTDRLWGRFPLHSGAAFFHFVKGGRVQHLIHNLKYNNRPEVGYLIGLKYGLILRDAPLFKDIDLIIPVPLHPRKQRQRGYNQSETFARGLAESFEVDYYKNVLFRNKHTTTQTKKSRLERLDNVGTAFSLKSPERLRGKNLLIVDDVLTTGATLEACALECLKISGVRISMVTIGLADR